ncbi:MAG: hypothetical protein ACRD2K_05390 [Terriglobales bacterium]
MPETLQLRRLNFTVYDSERGKQLLRIENTGDVAELPAFIEELRLLLLELDRRRK